MLLRKVPNNIHSRITTPSTLYMAFDGTKANCGPLCVQTPFHKRLPVRRHNPLLALVNRRMRPPKMHCRGSDVRLCTPVPQPRMEVFFVFCEKVNSRYVEERGCSFLHFGDLSASLPCPKKKEYRQDMFDSFFSLMFRGTSKGIMLFLIRPVFVNYLLQY